MNQLEEQLSNTLRAVDKLSEDMQIIKDYTVQNNKVVNELIRKTDDMAEHFANSENRFNKMFEESDRRTKEFEKKFEQSEKKFEQSDKKFEESDKRFERIIQELVNDRKQREKELVRIDKRLERLESRA